MRASITGIKTMEIPVIDISLYRDPSASLSSKRRVVEAVHDACSRFGFLQLIGHGVPVDAQRAILHCAETFFDQPLKNKEALSMKSSPSWRGYERLRGQTLDKSALPDEKEGFYIGREEKQEMGFRRGPNQWPDMPVQDFRIPVTNYYQHMLELARTLMEILALGLGHEISALDTLTKEPSMNLKLLHYPPHRSRDLRQFGAGKHTDFGAITLLLQEPDKQGLQVRYDGEWIDVPAVEDVLIINIGDLLGRWSKGIYQSTVHRVRSEGEGHRYSVPCFYEGDYSAKNPFDPDGAAGETVEEHIRRRFNVSYDIEKAAE